MIDMSLYQQKVDIRRSGSRLYSVDVNFLVVGMYQTSV